MEGAPRQVPAGVVPLGQVELPPIRVRFEFKFRFRFRFRVGVRIKLNLF